MNNAIKNVVAQMVREKWMRDNYLVEPKWMPVSEEKP